VVEEESEEGELVLVAVAVAGIILVSSVVVVVVAVVVMSTVRTVSNAPTAISSKGRSMSISIPLLAMIANSSSG